MTTNTEHNGKLFKFWEGKGKFNFNNNNKYDMLIFMEALYSWNYVYMCIYLYTIDHIQHKKCI